MAASKGPPPKAPKVDLDDLVRQWESDRKSRVFLQLAEAYRKQDSLDAAISVLREGLKHHAAFAPAHVALARCLLAKGQLAQAQAELEPIFKRSPDNLLAGKVLAQVLQERGERQRALAILQQIAPYAPDDEEIADRTALLKAAVGGKPAAKSDSGDTAEFTTSDVTGGPPAPRLASAPAPAPALVAPAPLPSVAARPGAGEEILDAGEDDVLEIDADEELSAEPPPMPRPALPPDDLLGAPLQAPSDEDEDEFTSITLAELYEAQGGHAEAAVIYERLLRRKPGDASLQRAFQRASSRATGVTAAEPLEALAAPPPPPPARPRWEPVRPRDAARDEARIEAPTASSVPGRPATASGGRSGRLRAERRELRRWLAATKASRTAP
jgi:tetratricopeptide (TPR) repeat protein